MIYSAKEDYQSKETAQTYESRPMYRGAIGYLRKRVELRVINRFFDDLPESITVLDCPCGNGRWFETIAQKADYIEAVDVSVGMTEYAKTRNISANVSVSIGDAEALELNDNSVDYVFSYALMKHIPVPIQSKILKEFARVSRADVICSFAVFNKVSNLYWQWRKPEESYPLFQKQLDEMASEAGLKIVRQEKISQPFIGLEFLVQFAPLK